MTPDSLSPDLPDRMARPSRRAVVLGSFVLLLAGAAVASVGFIAAGADVSQIVPNAIVLNTGTGQLGTLPLHDEKPMKAIGKGVPGRSPSRPSPSATP